MSFDPKPQRTNVYSFEKPAPNDQNKKSKLMEDEIYIKIRPRTIIKSLSYVLLFVVVFYLGRFSVDAPDLSLTTSLFDKSSEPAKETAPATEKKMTSSIPTVGAAVTEPVKEEQKAVETTNPTPEPPTTTTESTEKHEEKVVTSYSKVAIAITSVKTDWKETWGKITQVTFTLKNNEEGTVKPSYIIMTVEGYTDDGSKKKMNLLPTAQKVPAGKSISASTVVPSGFAYSAATAGNLENVNIAVVLFDENGKAMASFAKDFNLKGDTPTNPADK